MIHSIDMGNWTYFKFPRIQNWLSDNNNTTTRQHDYEDARRRKKEEEIRSTKQVQQSNDTGPPRTATTATLKNKVAGTVLGDNNLNLLRLLSLVFVFILSIEHISAARRIEGIFTKEAEPPSQHRTPPSNKTKTNHHHDIYACSRSCLP